MITYKEYREEINRIFSRHTKHRFVDYYHCLRLGSEMTSLMVSATEELAARGEYKELFALANKAYLKWGKTHKDDSAGETQDFVWYVQRAWDTVYEAEGGVPHSKMYDWFERRIDESKLDYMEERMYEYLVEHFKEPELLQRKYDFLVRKKAEGRQNKNGYQDEFQTKFCHKLLLTVMADMEINIEEIRKHAESMPSYDVWKKLAEIEAAYGNGEEVIALYRKLAVKEDGFYRPRDNWHIKLKDIFRERGDEEQYLAELRAALTANVGNTELWQEYKSGIPQEQWPGEAERIFSSVKPGYFLAFPWYAMEDRYDLIMDGIEKGDLVEEMKDYEEVLKDRYPDRCLAVLESRARFEAEGSNNRKHYKEVAKLLRRLLAFPGGAERAAALADEWRVTYKLRRAMMEEISEF